MTPELQTWIANAKRLRSAADAAERDFMEFLRAGEENERLWRPAAPTYDRLLDECDICRPARYRNWCNARRIIPDAAIDIIGAHGALQAALIDDRATREKCLTEMIAVAKKNGVPLSEMNARTIRGRYKPAESMVMRNASKTEELERELRAARATIKALRKENEKLKAALNGASASVTQQPPAPLDS